MDAEQKLAWDSEVACAVLIAEGKDAYMIDLDQLPTFEYRMLLARLGCRYLGVIGIRNGVIDTQPVDWNAETINGLLEAVTPFMEYAAKKLAPKGDSVDWLTRLAALPDTREN